VEVRNCKICVVADPLALGALLNSLEELIDRVEAVENVVVDEDLEPEYFLLLRLPIAARAAVSGLAIPRLEAT
jgi:hypothetical protein